MHQIKRYLLIIIGFISVMLGLIGILLPLLPTTPFLILALFCFSRSSPYFRKKLLVAPYIGNVLVDWERDKRIDKKRKKQIILFIFFSFFFSILFLSSKLYLQLLLVFIMFVLLFFVSRINEK